MNIKTCPFCGGEADIWETDSTTHPYQVVCQTCYCSTDKCISEEIAIKIWNTRKPIDKAVKENDERIEGLVALLDEYDNDWVCDALQKAGFDCETVCREKGDTMKPCYFEYIRRFNDFS